MQAMANEELDQALKEEQNLHNLLLKSLLPKDDADERDCILEVRAGNRKTNYYSSPSTTLNLIKISLFTIIVSNFATGTGGEEASLFAMDVFKMWLWIFYVYIKMFLLVFWPLMLTLHQVWEIFAEKGLEVWSGRYHRFKSERVQGWLHHTGLGLYSCVHFICTVTGAEHLTSIFYWQEASAAISGADVYGKLKFESGVHRVQVLPSQLVNWLLIGEVMSLTVLIDMFF